MIYPIGGLILGALIGAYRARKQGGKPADLAQWAAVFAMIFGIVGLFIAIFLMRTAA